jgi:hypothetical protein
MDVCYTVMRFFLCSALTLQHMKHMDLCFTVLRYMIPVWWPVRANCTVSAQRHTELRVSFRELKYIAQLKSRIAS